MTAQEPVPVPWAQQPGPSTWGALASDGSGGSGGPGATGPARNGMGTAALVLGVLGLLTSPFLGGVVLGVPALVLGVLGVRRARRGEATNGGTARAGAVLGVLGLAVTAGLLVLALVNDDARRYIECVRDAETSAASQACDQELRESIDG